MIINTALGAFNKSQGSIIGQSRMRLQANIVGTINGISFSFFLDSVLFSYEG